MDSNQLNTLYILERISTEMKGNFYKGTLITSPPERVLTLLLLTTARHLTLTQ